MIKDRKEKPPRPIEIDLSGPDGNAFVLISIAMKLSKQLGFSTIEQEDLKNRMMMGSYEDLLLTFDEHFGNFVILYREGGKPENRRDLYP